MRRLSNKAALSEARRFKTLLLSRSVGSGVGVAIPQPTVQNQIVVSNAALAWSLLAAPSAQHQILITGADPYTPAWAARFDATVPNTIERDDPAAAGSATVAARRDHEHAIVCAAAVATGTANAEGNATSFARSNHVHILHDHDHTGDAGDGAQISHDTALTGVSVDDHHAQNHKDRHDPVDGADPLDTEAPIATGTANAQGTSHNFVRGDHVHLLHVHDHTGDTGDGGVLAVAAISDLAYATPGLTLSTSNAAGSADTVIRTDATILVFDATVPDVIQPDDSAAAGAAGVAARRDHEHGIVCAAPASPSVSLAASAEGSGTSFARADHTHQLNQAIAPTWTGLHTFRTASSGATAEAAADVIVEDSVNAYLQLLSSGSSGFYFGDVASASVGRFDYIHASNTMRLWADTEAVKIELRGDDGEIYILGAMADDLNLGSNDITNVGTVDSVDVSDHDARHERAGADEMNGDHLDIDLTPSNYTPTTVPAEAAHVDDLAAHLAGIDNWLGSDAPRQYAFTFDGKMSSGGTGWAEMAGDFYYDTSKYPTGNAAWRATLKIRTGGGPEAQIRLWDVTTSSSVATLTTTNAAYQHLSASVSLTNGHYYRIRMREDTGGNFADALGTYLEW